MNTPIQGKNIIIGVTGSIAAYKAAELASRLTKAEATVESILTQAALQFITPLTFQSVTGCSAFVDEDLWGNEGHVQHISLGMQANLLVIAPASANTLAKLAHGIADNLLSLTALAARCPILVAPAMDGGMYSHPATQNNINILRSRGVIIVGPAEGRMASGLIGLGRMVEAEELFGQIRMTLGKDGKLHNRRVIVTAGGTSEPIDPVRFITNRSSGKQGYAIAQAAIDHGADVTLISGATHLPTPVGAKLINVITAQEMLNAVLDSIPHADILIMSAAVADFRPEMTSTKKIKKDSGIPEIQLTYTPDILSAVSHVRDQTGFPSLMIGFAAESQDLIESARKKLEKKNLDLIIANDISAQDAGFGVDTNRVTLIDGRGGIEALPLLSKTEVANKIIMKIISLLEELNE